MNRHRASFSCFHALGCGLPPLYSLCYAPIIARFLMAHGVPKWLGWVLGFAGFWGGMNLGHRLAVVLPPRFAKLANVIEFAVWVLPALGILVLLVTELPR